MGEQERESEGVAIGTPVRSERKGAADGARRLGRYVFGGGGLRALGGPHKPQRSSSDRGPHRRGPSSYVFEGCLASVRTGPHVPKCAHCGGAYEFLLRPAHRVSTSPAVSYRTQEDLPHER